LEVLHGPTSIFGHRAQTHRVIRSLVSQAVQRRQRRGDAHRYRYPRNSETTSDNSVVLPCQRPRRAPRPRTSFLAHNLPTGPRIFCGICLRTPLNPALGLLERSAFGRPRGPGPSTASRPGGPLSVFDQPHKPVDVIGARKSTAERWRLSRGRGAATEEWLCRSTSMPSAKATRR
jgi:hypothetical protein